MISKSFKRGGPIGPDGRVDVAEVGYEAFVVSTIPQELGGEKLRLDQLIIGIACHAWSKFDEQYPLSAPKAPPHTPEFHAELLDQMALSFDKMASLDDAKDFSRTFKNLAQTCRSAASDRSNVSTLEVFLAGLSLGNTRLGSSEFNEERLAWEKLAIYRKAQDRRLKPVSRDRREREDKILKFYLEEKARDNSISDAEIDRRFRTAEGLKSNTSNYVAKIIRRLRKDGSLQEDSKIESSP